jgi:hypothetical protein
MWMKIQFNFPYYWFQEILDMIQAAMPSQQKHWYPPGLHPFGFWNCVAAKRNIKDACPAFGKECQTCHKSVHFQSL